MTSRPNPPPMPKSLHGVEPKPIDDDILSALAELDGIDTDLRSMDVAWVQAILQSFGHPEIASRLGAAMTDMMAALKDAYGTLKSQDA